MGASKSRALLAEVKAARTAEAEMRNQLSERDRDYDKLTSDLEDQKLEYERKYLELETKHCELQERFLDLKSKFESDEMSSGDFTNRASELNRKLNEALSERDFIRLDAQKQIEALLSTQKNFEEEIRDLRLKLQQGEATYEEKIRCLEMERQVLLEESAEKDDEMQRIREESDGMRSKFQIDVLKLEEEYNQKGLLVRKQHNEERAELNRRWELKMNEVMQNCNEEVTKFRASLAQENSNLQDKLNTALNDVNSLNRKYKLLNNLFEEIRSRYERRESRKEDLERIADLEGQLIIQSEEIERQRDILKSVKFPTPQGNANPNSRRSRRNARKQKQKLNMTNNSTGNDYEANVKTAQRCRISSSSSGSSSSSETKGEN